MADAGRLNRLQCLKQCMRDGSITACCPFLYCIDAVLGRSATIPLCWSTNLGSLVFQAALKTGQIVCAIVPTSVFDQLHVLLLSQAVGCIDTDPWSPVELYGKISSVFGTSVALEGR